MENFNIIINKQEVVEPNTLTIKIKKKKKDSEGNYRKQTEADINTHKWDREFLDNSWITLKSSALHLLNIEIRLTLMDRMAIGMGYNSVHQTNLALHHLYGFPYIPASSIKGFVRHYLESEEKLQKNLSIFGYEEDKEKKQEAKQGQVIFFDAYPTQNLSLEMDIMNPHYPDYYGKDKKDWPTDTQSPNPIKFPVVKTGTVFQTIIGVKGEQEALLNKAYDYLSKAFRLEGIGAKTALGYGRMKVSKVENHPKN